MLVDVDDTIIEVHGYAKQGSGYGYSGVRGLNVLLATVTTARSAPVIVAQRLRKGACGSPRGAARLVADALKTVQRLTPGVRPLMRADSAFYGHRTVSAAVKAGADVSVTVRLDPRVKAAIAAIPDNAWQTIDYTDAVYDEATHQLISSAEVAERPSPRSRRRRKPTRSLAGWLCAGSPTSTTAKARTPYSSRGFHAFFTTTPVDRMDTVAADQTHRRHAIIEQVHADLKHSALAHLPSGRFSANAAWLVCAVIAFNLTRAAATLTGPTLGKATTATIRRKLITVPARIATSARRITLHLPQHWPWETGWTTLFTRVCGPPTPTRR